MLTSQFGGILYRGIFGILFFKLCVCLCTVMVSWRLAAADALQYSGWSCSTGRYHCTGNELARDLLSKIMPSKLMSSFFSGCNNMSQLRSSAAFESME